MWGFFKRKSRGAPVMASIWHRIGSVIEVRQRRAADGLNERTRHWGKRELRLLLVMVGLLFGGGAGLVLWGIFTGGPGHARRTVLKVTDSIMRRERLRRDSLDMLEGIYKKSLKTKHHEATK